MLGINTQEGQRWKKFFFLQANAAKKSSCKHGDYVCAAICLMHQLLKTISYWKFTFGVLICPDFKYVQNYWKKLLNLV